MAQFLEYYENSSMGESAVHALREEEEVRLFGALGGELRVRREGVDEVPCFRRKGLAISVWQLAELDRISKILQILGGLVLGCIKTKFCKKICV